MSSPVRHQYHRHEQRQLALYRQMLLNERAFGRSPPAAPSGTLERLRGDDGGV